MAKQGAIIAATVRRIRKARGMTQRELARRAGMTPGQLCKLELGRNGPTGATLRRLADALDVRVALLLGEDADVEMPPLAEVAAPLARQVRHGTAGDEFVRIRCDRLAAVDEAKVRAAVMAHESRVGEIESAFGMPSVAALQLAYPYAADLRSAELTARDMRQSLGAGRAPIPNLAELLELHNVRVIPVELPERFQSAAYWNARRGTLSIALNAGSTIERNTYRLAYELGAAALFVSTAYRPQTDCGDAHAFLRTFAASFLMPEEMVRIGVARFGVRPDAWTLPLLVAVKRYFCVSAEAFALRLETLGLIDPALRQKLRDALRARYKAHQEAMEPASDLNRLEVLELAKRSAKA